MTLLAREPRRVAPALAVAAIMLLAGVCGALFGMDVPRGKLVGIGLVVLVIGFAVTVLHPNLIYYSFAFVLGAVPFAVVPGLSKPVVLVLAVALWAALLTHPIVESRSSMVEFTVGLLGITSLLSLTMTTAGMVHIIEFAKWALATSILFVLLRIDRRVLRRFGQVFAIGTFFGAAFALGVFFLDKAGNTLNYLSVIGYGRTGTIGTHLRFYIVDNSTVVRLTGTYVDPNAAGIFLLMGFGFAVALLRGKVRLIMAPVILGALIITLSRSAIFSLLVGFILFFIFQRMSTGFRLGMIGAAILGIAGALSVPAIHSRIFKSFGASDTGANDRADALRNFTNMMSGHWLFGRGWGVSEFTDEVAGYQTNYVANSPLLTIYRGGIFTGLAFVAVLIAAAALAYRRSRQSPWESGVLGALFVGFSLVGLQLDFPVVTHAPMTMAFSVFLAFVSVNPVEPQDAPDVDRRASEATGNRPGASEATGNRPALPLSRSREVQVDV